MEFVTRVASSVVGKILEYPVGLIGRHLGYLIYYQTNKKSLTDREPELDDKISSVQRRARAARRNGEELEEYVTGWISEAERKVQEAKDVINDRGHENAKCSCNGSFPNLVSRYKLSKKAKIMAENIVIDLQKADNFGNFSYRPLIQPSFKNKDYEAFDTRKQTLKEIMEALRDPNLTMIGVYGMGGIGKTTLVTDVARQAKEEECFSELVMVTVSQDFDLKSIQKGIAEGLGLKLDEEDMSARANRLQHRLRQGNKILIILDDIWNELDLSKAGIHFDADDQRGCKILLVSRDQEVLYSRMRVRKNIEVKVLSNSESMSLFYKYVGDKADNLDFETLANQVVGECGGLPIAIATIACSLENKSLLVWKDTLRQLKKSPKRGMYGKVYLCIRTSYDFLESEEEKKLLLLCSLHGEDANVPVYYLMIYGIGWDLFQEVGTMEEAMCRVHSLVHKLKACCLLLNGDYEGSVKMHDVIRDVMISVAKEDEHMHCLTKVAELEECLHKEDFREYSKAIVLLGPNFNNQLLPRLVCPKLQLLLAFDRWYRFQSQFPDDFFKEAQELKALIFDCFPLESLPQSFCTLQHLRALRLQLGEKADLTLIGELRNLIALDLSGSTFSQLPEHIGKLKRLRSLNLSGCESLTVIQPNVISSLVRLEELYMAGVNIDWEVEGRVCEGRNASLMEFKNLQNLTTLHLNVRDASVLPKYIFSENLQRYRIVIGSFQYGLRESNSQLYQYGFTGSRLLYLNLRESTQLYQYGIQNLMKNSEGMLLEEFHGVDNIVYELDIYSFPQLKNFCLKKNDEVRYIVHSRKEIQPCSTFQNLETLYLENLRNLEKICYGNVTMESFGKLRRIYVRNCDKLKNLFSFSIARKIEEIEVSECKMMEMLVYHGSKDAAHGNINSEAISEKLEFPQLRYLNLNSLSNLIFFWSGLGTTCGSSLSDSPQPLFGEKVVFPTLKVLKLSQMNFRELWSPISCMQNLSSLDVSSCPNLKYLFTVAMAGKLPQLETLKIRGCPVMEGVVVTNEHGEGRLEKILFPKLKSLELEDLPNLKRFCKGDCIECPSLLKLTIGNCGVLRMFISSNEEEVEGPFFKEKVVFPTLKFLYLSQMKFKEIWSTISCLQNLSSLDISNCPNLKYLFTVAMAGKLPQLETLKIRGCPVMEGVVVTNEHREGRSEKILCPKLKSLELEDLPNLRRFCTGDCIECPSLLKLRIENCDVLRMFISSNKEEVEGPFFNEKVSFPILEELRLKRLNLKILWADQLSITSFGIENLKRLNIQNCDSLSHLFSLDVARSFLQLEELLLWSCKGMEEVLVTKEPIEQGTPQKISFPKLKNLVLSNLQNIRRFCAGCCIEFPSLTNIIIQRNPAMRTFITDSCNGASGELMGSEARRPLFNGKVAFPKLEKLRACYLDSVNSLFSFAVAKSLVTLKRLEVLWCSLMEEIVQVNEQGEEGRLEKISFPKLQRLRFHCLSNLKRFYGGACIEFPSLLKLEIPADTETQEIMDRVVLCPNLEELNTTSSELIKEMCNCQSSRAPPFCNLKVVDLKCFRNEPIGFSLKCIQRYQNLESLSLSGFFVDTTHHHRQIMVSLEEHERPLKRLKKLRLSQLSTLTHLFEDLEDSENSSLESLKFLHIQECDKLMSPLLSPTTYFQNLMALVVSECSAMINLLASTTAKSLVHLRLMSITKCKQMTEIIMDEIVDDEIVFGKLEILELSELPSLRSFHSTRNSVMRFPNLVKLFVSQCPKMRSFSSGMIDAPKLYSISEIEKNKYRWRWLSESNFDSEMLLLPEPQQKLWEGDINKTLEKLWENGYSLVMQRLFTETSNGVAQRFLKTESCSWAGPPHVGWPKPKSPKLKKKKKKRGESKAAMLVVESKLREREKKEEKKERKKSRFLG